MGKFWRTEEREPLMPTQRKIESLANLTDKMSRMQFAIVADYRGLTVAEMYDLRNKMRESGADVVIAKNTLLRMAARNTGNSNAESLFVGPTAVAFAYDDPAKVAKAFRDYLKESKKLSIRGGVLGTSIIQPDELEDVTKMPSRQVLYGQILGGIQSPITGLLGTIQAPLTNVVGCLQSAISDVVYVLQARIDQVQSAN
jgi:large subunit ribosomal protein L10